MRPVFLVKCGAGSAGWTMRRWLDCRWQSLDFGRISLLSVATQGYQCCLLGEIEEWDETLIFAYIGDSAPLISGKIQSSWIVSTAM